MNNEDFIRKNKTFDVRTLALRKVAEGVDLKFCLQQIEGWQLAKGKLPRWAEVEGLLFPPRLSMEQCSSERTALYKHDVVNRLLGKERACMADLTGGFGVDFSYLAPLFNKAIYVERSEMLCQIAKQNFCLLGLHHAEVCNADSEDVLHQLQTLSFIYIDPARRDDAGRKVVALQECTPDVTALCDLLLDRAPVVMIKLSPMLDIHQAMRDLGHVAEVHVVSVDGECKELLLVLQREQKPLHYHCVNITSRTDDFFLSAETSHIATICTGVHEYLYEPNASVLKAGVQDALCEEFQVEKLHPFSHLFTSCQPTASFPGRAFAVERVGDFSKQGIKDVIGDLKKANLACRNFPQSVAELRKRLKLKEGGDVYLFATTLHDGRHVLIRCRKCGI